MTTTVIKFPYDLGVDGETGEFVLGRSPAESFEKSFGIYNEIERFSSPAEAEDYFLEHIGAFMYE